MELAALTAHFDQPTNRLYQIRQSLSRRKIKVTDLVSGNVGAQGILFPPKILGSALSAAQKKTRLYQPDPLGRIEARQAVSRFYAGAGIKIPPEQILMTPGTSLSYWYAFKVLADPGDDILAPSPCYPLFDSIAQFSGVKLSPYYLRERSRWEIDFAHLESAVTPRTRAIILISPHNPTGAVATEAEVRKLATFAAERNIAIISDEVFSPFLFSQKRLPRPAAHKTPLVLTLNGLSKMLALPGVKIGWMAVTGEAPLVAKTMRALDMISDTFLPVNEAAQAALPRLLSESRSFQSAYVREIAKRRQEVLPWGKPEGGFFLTLKLKDGMDEEESACQLLEKHHFLVHPGYFFDMEGQHLVLSFVSRPEILRKALRTIADLCR